MKRTTTCARRTLASGLVLMSIGLLTAGTALAQGDNLGNHSATQNLGLNDYDLRLRAPSDGNHGLGYYGSAKSWNGLSVDGPVLFGYSGGVLGTNQGGTRTTALTWNNTGRVGIGTGTPAYLLHVAGTANVDGVLSTSARLGVGTTAPAQLLHLLNSNTPGVRLDQNDTGGYAAQTWGPPTKPTSSCGT